MEWTVHGERSVYESPWVSLRLVDIEVPDGPRFDHHVVRTPRPAVGVVVSLGESLLLLHRHRFITDTWGWEVPAGRIDPGEDPEQAAGREVLEETGWRAGPLEPLVTYHPLNGSSDATFHLFGADGAELVGAPSDPDESERVEWLPWDRVREEIAAGRVGDGMSLSALLWWVAFVDG